MYQKTIIKKSLNQYPNIEARTSDEIQPLENYENSTVVFDDMLLSKQESNNGLFFNIGIIEAITIVLIFTIFLKVKSICQKILFVIFLYNCFI